MSKNLKKAFANGAIVRIKLENFVTYDSLEFSPGSNLNVIIGPNGTGKSSIVCAICLGMAGKPTVLGRAAAISDYIKYGHNKALIEIELNNSSGKNFTIRRVIYKDNKSDWFLNDNPVKLKEIEELVGNLNIQVGNLCQFLPQEKVSEFARLNSYELLESTEKAVGGLELYEKHMELKNNSKKSRDLDKEVKELEESLRKEETANARIESQVSSYLEKKKFEDNVIWLKRKRACLIYKDKKEAYEHIKKEKNKINQELSELGDYFGPLEEQKQKIEIKIQKQKNILSSKSKLIQECFNKEREISTKLNDYADKVNEIKSEYQMKENEIKQRKTTIENLKEQVETLKTQSEEAKLDMESIQENENAINKRDQEQRVAQDKLSTKQYENNQEISKLKSEHEEINKKLNMMKSVREEKLKKLRCTATQHAYDAVEWLSKNRHLFKGQVFEPMFLLINVKHQQSAKYVEAAISFRDLCSLFLFERSDDMHLFMNEVRDNLKLVVHTALIPQRRADEFLPPKPLNEIKKYGFHSYIRDIIDAPEAIVVYLCLYSQIHNIPIGTDYTQKNLAAILPQITEFKKIYTNTHSYGFSKSRYTQKISSSSSEISQGYWLTTSTDTSEINKCEARKSEIETKLKQLEQEQRQLGEEKQKIEKIIESSRNELNKLRESKQYIINMEKKYQINLKKLKALEAESTEIFGDAAVKSKFICDVAKKRVKAFSDYIDSAKTILVLNKDKAFAAYDDTLLQIEKRKLESQLREYVSKKLELDNAMENIDARIKQGKDEANNALLRASEINGYDLKNGVPDVHKAKFFELPNTVEEIENEIHQCEAISQASYNVDERLVEDFKQRKKTIEKLKKEFDTKKAKLENHQQNYESLKNEWIDQVEEMIQQINEKFSKLFRQLKCAGEVSLSRSDIPDDFARYGVCIKVSFRNDEQLQELTAWQQSGGEKSVSTMMFMIALQEMTKCPFRVVDEINQGMDPINERKVFDIIVQNSCSKLFAQYFLLTPKLLPDLSFDEKTNVICVFNGPHNLAHSKYNLEQFIETRKKINLNNK